MAFDPNNRPHWSKFRGIPDSWTGEGMTEVQAAQYVQSFVTPKRIERTVAAQRALTLMHEVQLLHMPAFIRAARTSRPKYDPMLVRDLGKQVRVAITEVINMYATDPYVANDVDIGIAFRAVLDQMRTALRLSNIFSPAPLTGFDELRAAIVLIRLHVTVPVYEANFKDNRSAKLMAMAREERCNPSRVGGRDGGPWTFAEMDMLLDGNGEQYKTESGADLVPSALVASAAKAMKRRVARERKTKAKSTARRAVAE